jgi:excisionase family DNA binding protein
MDPTKPTSPCPLLTLEEAAEFLGGKEHGATPNFLRTQIAEGELKFVKVGNTFCVTREALLRWIQTHETEQKPKPNESRPIRRSKSRSKIGQKSGTETGTPSTPVLSRTIPAG